MACDVELTALLPHLASVLVEAVEAGEGLVRITVRTAAGVSVICPGCGQESAWEHSRYVRHVADEAIGGSPVLIDVSVRRLYCENSDCSKTTFAEQVPGLTVRYQRRTPALQKVIASVATALAGRAGARLLVHLHQTLSWASMLTCLLRIPLPTLVVPAVLGVDDFALRRGHRYATILINAETRERVEVLPDRKSETLTAWLRTHPGVEAVCRDGAAGYAQAVTDALPQVPQITDRWHLWHNLGEAVLKEVHAHAGCWAKCGPPSQARVREETTRERWHQVHALLDQGVGLLDCARRLQLALNTVKRYARVPEPEQLKKAPQYRPTLVDPYRDHLRRRREEDPAVSVRQLLQEIKKRGYQGSSNLLYRYINQGRVESDRPAVSPRRLKGLLCTEPEQLKDKDRELLTALTGACPEMTALAGHIRSFAALLTPAADNARHLEEWISQVREDDLPHLHAFTRGLERDHDAVVNGLTLPFHNGGTEGVNTKTKLIKRQMYGRAGFRLLRHRILLN
ncbi:ISL3 family transposase [Streptomyces sp. NBC_00893]|uniref:ISL3 family transposase n=1 Tax=Streptomyces sp. NBC_00893 TaxID=2975862 RepID=UPI00224CFA07|nr:ISL3 family transposase [Streptomyces sp. NBC_00893]MCX4852088.1 ISL3 family transposase [Streptomyces sp. NBC_00893]